MENHDPQNTNSSAAAGGPPHENTTTTTTTTTTTMRSEIDMSMSIDGFEFISIDETPPQWRGINTLDEGADAMLMGSGFNDGFKTQLKRMLSSEDEFADDSGDSEEEEEEGETAAEEEEAEAEAVPTTGHSRWYSALRGPDDDGVDSSMWLTPTPLAPSSFLDRVVEEDGEEEGEATPTPAPRVGSLPITIAPPAAAERETSAGTPNKRHHSDPVAIPARPGHEVDQLPVSESMLSAMMFVKAQRLRDVAAGRSNWHRQTNDLLREVEGEAAASPLSARSSFSECSDSGSDGESDFEECGGGESSDDDGGDFDDEECFGMEL